MYAIIFDIDTSIYVSTSPMTGIDLYPIRNIHEFIESHNFVHQHDSIYFGDETTTSVSCVLLMQKLNKKFPWFSACVKNVSMLHVEEKTNLLEVLK